MIVVDEEGIISFVNPATEALFCLPKTELLGSCFGFPLIRTQIDILRPYGRGTATADMALAEIENNRGILYDAKIVDACLRLFREKDFTFG